MDREKSPETLCNHPKFLPLPVDNRPLTPPIYQSAKFTINSMQELKKLFKGDRDGYFYSRYKNPTCDVLEGTLATLQKTEACRTTATGVAAISAALIGLLRAGDRLIYFIESYRPSRIFAERLLQRYGVEVVRLSLEDHEGIRREMALPKTRAVLFEAITNPQLKAAPLALIYEEAKKNGVITVLDNTFAGFQSWPDWPFDVYVHSLTKYASGHGDVMGGAILGSKELLGKMDETLGLLGGSLDPHAAFLIQRGLRTYHIRRRAAAANAMQLAKWLSEHEAIETLLYPGLPTHPQHSWFQKHFDDFGTMIFFNLKNKKKNIEELVTRGELFQLAASLGSTESLIAPALFFYGTDLSPKERAQAGIDSTSVRLSIGIEHIDDLKADLEKILS